jgi:hypothetical protein
MLPLVNSRSNKSQAQKSHLKGWLIMLKVFLLLPICGTCVLDWCVSGAGAGIEWRLETRMGARFCDFSFGRCQQKYQQNKKCPQIQSRLTWRGIFGSMHTIPEAVGCQFRRKQGAALIFAPQWYALLNF